MKQSNFVKCLALVCALSLPAVAFAAAGSSDAGTGATGSVTPSAGSNNQPGPTKPTGLQ